MDEKMRRFIREAELERMHAREGRRQLQAQRQLESNRKYEKAVAYVRRYGRQKAVLRTIKKWTMAFLLLAMLIFPATWADKGIGQAFLSLLTFPVIGGLIGMYRASRLPEAD